VTSSVGVFRIRLVKMKGVEIAQIPCVPAQCDALEETAQELAARASKSLESQILQEVSAIGDTNSQLLLQRTAHYVARRAVLTHVAAATREADVNDPSRALHHTVPAAPSVGYMAMEPQPAIEEKKGTAPAEVKLRSGYTYVFEHEPDHVRVVEFESKGSGVKINLDDEFNRSDTLNGHSPGTLICGSTAENVFVKEKVLEDDKPAAALEETAMETATCAALATTNCFVGVRAIQVFKTKTWLAFEKLPGRTFDSFLDVVGEEKRLGTEAEIAGGALLVLDAYCKLRAAGYQQRDVKSGNLWIMDSEDTPVHVRVIDTDAVLKIGHMTDAREEGYTNEEWNARALGGGRLWDLGGADRNTCSAYCSNVDLMSKQCVPGEQSVVFSVSEIFLRMMGQDDICYELQEEGTWEDVMNATVAMDKHFDDEDEEEGEEDEEDEEKEEKEEAELKEADEEEDEDDKVPYSEALRHLVLAFRRRAFTQGGVDALLDLHTARAVVQDFIATHLQSTPDECTAAFGAMVREFAAKSASAEEEEEDEDEDEEEETVDKNQKWTELTDEEAAKYLVCPISNQDRKDKKVKFKMVGLALREKRPLVPDPSEEEEADGDIFLKAPQFSGFQRAALPTTVWCRTASSTFGPLLDEIRGRGGVPEAKIAKAMEKVAGERKLSVNGDVLCTYLNIRAQDLFGDDQIASWPTVSLYPYSAKLERRVEKLLTTYRDSLPAAGDAKELKENAQPMLARKKTPILGLVPAQVTGAVKPKPSFSKLPSMSGVLDEAGKALANWNRA